MANNRPRILAQVDPMKIVIEPKLVRSTDWDQKAVAEDLKEYVRLSRLNKGTPVIRPVDGILKLVSGEPFLRAAQEAQPPLAEIVCEMDADEPTVQSLGLSTITATELLDKYPEHETYNALEMLAFSRAVTAAEKKSIQDRIAAFFKKMKAHPSQYGGNYSSISPFEWDQLETRIHWKWERNDQPGRCTLLFLDLLRDINQSVAPLRSWNGLAPQITSQAEKHKGT